MNPLQPIRSLLERFADRRIPGNPDRDVSVLHCIGDSHAMFFSGLDRIQPTWPARSEDVIPGFRSYRLGPVLAYNLSKWRTRSRGREKLFQVLRTQVPKGGKVLLCFGEIDCRAHLIKQSRRQNRPVEELARECVERYFTVVKEVKALSYQVLVWNVIPSTSGGENSNSDFPAIGTCPERNAVTRCFNRHLESLCRAGGIPFVSVFDPLVGPDEVTRTEFYIDMVHLSQAAMPMALEALKPHLDGPGK